MSQVKKPRPTVSKTESEEIAGQDAAKVYESEKDRLARVKAKGEEIKEELDDLLDEIDGLLEEHDVLVNFRQRGGQAVRVVIDAILGGFRIPPIGWL